MQARIATVLANGVAPIADGALQLWSISRRLGQLLVLGDVQKVTELAGFDAHRNAIRSKTSND